MTALDTVRGWRTRYDRARERRWFRWTVDLSILAAIVLAIGAWQTRGHLDGPAPAFNLRTLDGKQVSLAELGGQPTLIAFWAPWCGVCKTETSNFSWAMKLAGSHARVISIAAGYNDVSEVQRYVRDQGVDYPVLLGDERLTQAWRVEAFPTVYFLDAQGRVKHSVVGYTTTVGLLARLLL